MLKKIATIFGAVMLLVGVLGFIPGIVTSDGLLLGIFKVDTLHNLIHIVTGAVALYVGMSSYMASKTYFQIFGVVYALVAVLGFIYMDKPLLGILAHNTADAILHTLIAALSLYLGFAGPMDDEKAM